MILALQIIGILFMLTLIFIGIWSFILANKAYSQIKYKNYLLEKISNRLAILTETTYDKKNSDSDLSDLNTDDKEEIFDTYADLFTDKDSDLDSNILIDKENEQ